MLHQTLCYIEETIEKYLLISPKVALLPDGVDWDFAIGFNNFSRHIMLQGKVAIITGASRGIGRAIAQSFAKAGATIVFTYSNPQNLSKVEELEQELKVCGIQAQGVLSDISNPEHAKTLVKTTLDNFGKIDVLVNNAGISRDGLLARLPLESWHATINTNLNGVFYLTQQVLSPMMRAKQGSIVNLSSIVGIRGNAGQSAYAAAKAGVIGFTKSVALEYASRNIRANAIAPGFITTDMTAYLHEGSKAEEYLQNIPLKRFGKVEDIANAALFLASDQAAYITGQVLSVCGGLNI